MKIDSYLAGVVLVIGTEPPDDPRPGGRAPAPGERAIWATTTSSGSLYQVAGTLYAVILGLIVVDAMDRFHEASRLDRQRGQRAWRTSS